MIVAENLTKRFGSRVAVDGVNFTVPRGEIVGFLGPNGAGKSTTLKMVAGYLPPTAGRVRVAGHDLAQESIEARRRLGYMPEAAPLYPEMRVEEYLAFRAEIKGVRTGRREAVGRAMEQADVADVSRRLIGELSKGYRQRVGLADALVASPELLILDEPTAGLDPNQILHVRQLIRSLGSTHTIFLSTHILPEVEAVCSRVVIISRGRVVAEGTPAEVRAGLGSSGRAASIVVRGASARVAEVVDRLAAVEIRGEPQRIGTDGADDTLVARYELSIDETQAEAEQTIEALAAACVAAGLGLRGIATQAKSLESVFHELTTTDAALEARAPTSEAS